MRGFELPLLLAVALSPSCSAPDRRSESGWLEAKWTGADTGQMAGFATAEWCGERRALEIRGVQGDTGLAVVLYSLDTIQPDTYRVVPPGGADSLAPSAGIALRVFSNNAIDGYRSDSGTFVLDRERSGELSGSLDASAISVANGRRLSLSGKVQGLTVVPQARGCSPPAPTDSADSNAQAASTE